MKDRTPKFPGRVKLKPVAGQTDTYDMTRADDPDDTGTPFNTRTMLQDSTARFLRLPISNPFVDDALRHMPDRIEPIGTVKTSPALSLGDAWLPCDGSQVAFTEYPQLCQILRNTVGDVTFDGITVGTAPNFSGMSRVVKFKGKFYIAGCYYNKPTGTLSYHFTLSIASSESATGPYTVVYTENITISGQGAYNEVISGGVPVQLTASEEKIAAVFDTRGVNSFTVTLEARSVFQVVSSEDGNAWARKSIQYSTIIPASDLTGEIPVIKAFVTDGTYWAFTTEQYVFYTDDPGSNGVWSAKEAFISHRLAGRIVYLSGKWIAIVGSAASNKKEIPTIWTAAFPNGHWTSVGDIGSKEEAVTRSTPVVYYSGKYWLYILSSGLFHSDDLKEWIKDDAPASIPSDLGDADLLATDRMLAIITANGTVRTSSDPDLGWSTVTLPAGSAPMNLSADGDIIMAPGAGIIAYHDYSTETRLLPTISLSNDTTTYIKARNELDVFEAQESGGD